MIKIMIAIIGLLVPIFLIYLNIYYPVDGGVYFSIFILVVAILKIWESFFTSNERERSKFHGDWTLIYTSLLYFIAGILVLIELFYLNRNILLPFTLFGILVFILGSALRRWSINSLGDQWGIHVIDESKLISNHKLIKYGPYKYIRHPIYLSYILDLIGIALICNTFYTLIFILTANLYSYYNRASKEESYSIIRFGEEYLEYKKSTSFIIPFINKK